MSRAVASAVLGATLVLGACSGGSGKSIAVTTACPLLAQLAQTGDTVAQADVADPVKFDTTLHSAVTEYVRTAQRLRPVVPLGLRGDVDRIVAAAEQYRFADAASARADLDKYARAKCDSGSSE
jgi:hypothetical protein